MTTPATTGPINLDLMLREHLPLAVRSAEARAVKLEKDLTECRAEITKLRQVAIASHIDVDVTPEPAKPALVLADAVEAVA